VQISVSAEHDRMLFHMLACLACALGNPTRWSPARNIHNNPHCPSALVTFVYAVEAMYSAV